MLWGRQGWRASGVIFDRAMGRRDRRVRRGSLVPLVPQDPLVRLVPQDSRVWLVRQGRRAPLARTAWACQLVERPAWC